jgi:hypothetical protein
VGTGSGRRPSPLPASSYLEKGVLAGRRLPVLNPRPRVAVDGLQPGCRHGRRCRVSRGRGEAREDGGAERRRQARWLQRAIRGVHLSQPVFLQNLELDLVVGVGLAGQRPAERGHGVVDGDPRNVKPTSSSMHRCFTELAAWRGPPCPSRRVLLPPWRHRAQRSQMLLRSQQRFTLLQGEILKQVV